MTALLLRRLSGLLLLVLLAAPAQAQLASRADQIEPHVGVHILKAGPNGGVVCDEATEADMASLNATANRGAGAMNLTALPSLNAPGVSNFRIILRATDQLLARPEALLSFRRAAARWERIIQSPVTTVIDVDYGPQRFNSGLFPANVLGSTGSAVAFAGDATVGPAQVIARMKANHTDDPQLTALYNAIPVPTPSTAPSGNGGRNLGRATAGLIPLQMLGFRPATVDPNDPNYQFGRVPSVGFNSAFAYDFDPANGITSNQTDFEGVAIHEIGHALGFSSSVNTQSAAATAAAPQFQTWDLFRVRPTAVTVGESLTDGVGWETALRVITPGPVNNDSLTTENGVTYFKAVQTTFTGDAAYETSTATGGRLDGDGQQASHWRDDALRPPSLGADRVIGIMDPNIGAGQVIPIKRPDIRLLELIGYRVVFNPQEAVASIFINRSAITEPLLVAERALGDVPIGGTASVPVTIRNSGATTTGTANPLNYEIEVIVDSVYPLNQNLTPTITLSQPSGTVAAGNQTDFTLTFGGINQAAFVSGRLQIRSNDGNRAFIEVPFTFSVGGATEPKLAVTSSLPATGNLGDLSLTGGARTFTVNVANTGSLPLDYKVLASASVRALPFSTVPTGSTTGQARVAAQTLFQANFENPADLSQFQGSSASTLDRWQVVSTGRATLDGHSKPNVAFFGRTGANGKPTYGNNAVGQLATPNLDLSQIATDDAISVSFNYFLKAEAGFDFASLVYSVDGGKTFSRALTSDGGTLRDSTANGWEKATVFIPGIAGFPQVQFAFRFTSDGGVAGEGFYIDDVVISTAPGRSAFFADSVIGTVPGNTSVPVTVTINAPGLDRGFYDGFVDIVTNQRGNDPAPVNVKFTVGSPVAPTLVSLAADPEFTIVPGTKQTAELPLRNPGDARLTYVRVLEPALSSYAEAPNRLTGDAVRATPLSPTSEISAEVEPETGAIAAKTATLPDGDILGQAVLPGAALLGDLTQLPDGRIVVLDIGLGSVAGSYGQAYILSADLSTIVRVPSIFTTQQTGIAYNSKTNSLWIADASTGTVREVTIGGTATAPTFVLTKSEFLAGFSPRGLAYSPELDALFTTASGSVALYAFDITGNVFPGYPVAVTGRGPTINSIPGLSFTDGLLEVGGATNLSIVQIGQFGRAFAEGVTVAETSERLGGSVRINGYLRSKTNRDGSAYYVANPASGVSRVFRVDPPNVPARITGSLLEATAPVFGTGIPSGETFAVPFVINTTGVPRGIYIDELAFLTNNPGGQLVRIPVTIRAGVATGTEETTPGVFAFQGAFPNPVRSVGTIRFDLPEATDVTVSVYNVLGQRVALLADGQAMGAGTHDVSFPAGGLASGTYVVRVSAGDNSGTQKITVVR